MSKKKIRRPQSYQKKQDPTFKEWWRAQTERTRKSIIYALIALAAVIVLICVWYYAIYDDGSLVIKDQAVVNKEDNWIIAELDSGKNSEYYKLGTVDAPDGYYLTDEDMTGTSSTVKYTTEFVYRPTDESGNTMVCVKGVGKSVDGMIDYVYDSFASLVEASEDDASSITEVTDLDTPSGKARYFIYTYSYESETDAGTTETKYTQYLVCYVPAYYKNSCVLVSVSINADSPDQFVANEVLETEMQKAIDAITITKK
jgi:hypothetical protein